MTTTKFKDEFVSMPMLGDRSDPLRHLLNMYDGNDAFLNEIRSGFRRDGRIRPDQYEACMSNKNWLEIAAHQSTYDGNAFGS
jgi:hypothetical protein